MRTWRKTVHASRLVESSHLEVELTKKFNLLKGKVLFYSWFNNQGHIGADPPYCHLWESNQATVKNELIYYVKITPRRYNNSISC